MRDNTRQLCCTGELPGLFTVAVVFPVVGSPVKRSMAEQTYNPQ